MAGKAEEKKPYYEMIADRLIKQLEEGTAPWQKPWEPGEERMPHNPVSGTRYKGANALWLAMQGRSDPRWMTYKQAQKIGVQVQKGEKSTWVQYWKFRNEVPKKDAKGNIVRDSQGKPVKEEVVLERPKVFSSRVFNAEQIEGLPPWRRKNRLGTGTTERKRFLSAPVRKFITTNPTGLFIDPPPIPFTCLGMSSLRQPTTIMRRPCMSLGTGPAMHRGWAETCPAASVRSLTPRKNCERKSLLLWSGMSWEPGMIPGSMRLM